MDFRRPSAHRLLDAKLSRFKGARWGLGEHSANDVAIAPLQRELQRFRLEDAGLRHLPHHGDAVIAQELLDARPHHGGGARRHHPLIAIKALNPHLPLFLRRKERGGARQGIVLKLAIGFHAQHVGDGHLVA